jgi:hypothetical protein
MIKLMFRVALCTLFISITQHLVGLCLSFPMHYTLGEKMVKGAKGDKGAKI